MSYSVCSNIICNWSTMISPFLSRGYLSFCLNVPIPFNLPYQKKVFFFLIDPYHLLFFFFSLNLSWIIYKWIKKKRLEIILNDYSLNMHDQWNFSDSLHITPSTFHASLHIPLPVSTITFYWNSTGYHNNTPRFPLVSHLGLFKIPPKDTRVNISNSNVTVSPLKIKHFRASCFPQGWLWSLWSDQWRLWVCFWQNFFFLHSISLLSNSNNSELLEIL